jgi:proteasome lid subunit RPN8/RPN11
MLAHKLEIPKVLWCSLVGELARSGQGRRESGAFLLGTLQPRRTVTAYILYDSISPSAQHSNYVLLLGKDMAKVWLECERQGVQVVADIHTHPRGPAQSISDRANPIVSISGHVALIVPNFATGLVRPEDLGVHEFQGKGCWKSWFDTEAASKLKFT